MAHSLTQPAHATAANHLVLPWLVPPKMVDTSLQTFQQCLVQGWLSKLALFGQWPLQDLRRQIPELPLKQVLQSPAALELFAQLVDSHKAPGLLSGMLLPVFKPGSQTLQRLEVTLYWYCARLGTYCLISTYPIQLFEPRRDTLTDLAPTPAELNQVLNWLCFQTLLLLDPKHAGESLGQLHQHRLVNHYNTLHQWTTLEQSSIKNNTERLVKAEALTQQDPEFELGFALLGRLYKLKRNYPLAIQNYEQAVLVSQAHETIRANYAIEAGICAALLGQTEQAIQLWLKAAALNPTSLKPYMNIAHMYEEQGQLEQAECFFRKAQVLAPNDSRLYYNLARVYSRQNQWGKALAQYQLQLVVDQQDPWCHSNIATCYLQLGDETQAAKHLKQTVALDAEGEAGQYAGLILAGIEA